MGETVEKSSPDLGRASVRENSFVKDVGDYGKAAKLPQISAAVVGKYKKTYLVQKGISGMCKNFFFFFFLKCRSTISGTGHYRHQEHMSLTRTRTTTTTARHHH